MLQTRGGPLRTQPWTQLLLPPAAHEVKSTKSMLCVWDTQQMGDNRDGSKDHWVDQGLSSSFWGPDLSPQQRPGSTRCFLGNPRASKNF